MKYLKQNGEEATHEDVSKFLNIEKEWAAQKSITGWIISADNCTPEESCEFLRLWKKISPHPLYRPTG